MRRPKPSRWMSHALSGMGCGVILLAGGCGSSVPSEWEGVAPADGLDSVVDAASNADNLSAFYEAGTSVETLRSTLRQNAESAGLSRGYHCEFPDGRRADGYLSSPNSMEWTIIPQDDGRLMLTVSRDDNTAEFAAPPDPEHCTMEDG